jgi:hypothetical protein
LKKPINEIAHIDKAKFIGIVFGMEVYEFAIAVGL